MGIIGFLVFGLVVGAVARLIKPGKQNLSILMTLVLGVVGSLIGGVVADGARHRQASGSSTSSAPSWRSSQRCC